MLIYWGLHRRETAAEVREKLALSRQDVPAWLAALAARVPLSEALVLSTCQRLEVYAVSPEPERVRQALDAWAQEQAGVSKGRQFVRGEAAAQHLFEVAAGLDSLVVGEPEILGQLRTAWALSHESGCAGPVLEGFVQHALVTGRQVRHQTAISQGRHSLESLALEQIANRAGRPVAALRWLVLGAGQLGLAVLRQLASRRAPSVTLINRTPLSDAPAGVRVLPWRALTNALAEADAVVVCTGAARPVLERAHFRGERLPLGVADLALPRNVAPEVAALLPLWDLSSLHHLLDVQRGQRFESMAAARFWLERGWQDYLTWRQERELAPFLAAVYAEIEAVSSPGVRRSRRQSLHPLVVALKQAATAPAQQACRSRLLTQLASWREADRDIPFAVTHGELPADRYSQV